MHGLSIMFGQQGQALDDLLERRIKRNALEQSVLSLVDYVRNGAGQIVSVVELSDAELYGIRDRARRTPFREDMNLWAVHGAQGCPHCARKFVSALSLHQHVEDRRSACWKRRQV